LKLLFVIDHLGPAGAQGQLTTLGSALKSRGHDVTFFVYYAHLDYFKERLEEAGIPLHVSPKRSKYDTRPPLELRRLVRSGKFDVSVSFLTTPNVYNVLSAARSATRTIVSERSAFQPGRVPIPVRVRFGLYRLADHIVVNSKHHHSRLCSEFPWMESKSSAIANGVDLGRFSPGDDESRGVSDRPMSILAVGSIHAGKNHLGLIEALHHYKSTYGDPPQIVWAGREPVLEPDVVAYREAKLAIHRYGLDSNWEWLGVRSDIPDLLTQHHAFIHPSFFEGLPNAVCEALAAGRPILASNVCDHPWLVEDGERGFLFDPLEPIEISAAIRRFVLLTREERHRMGCNARSFAEEALSVERFVDAYEHLFDSLSAS
jgi:glycosyltransferase involved in cell wall biosynthesis